jgi:hypothetical protein
MLQILSCGAIIIDFLYIIISFAFSFLNRLLCKGLGVPELIFAIVDEEFSSVNTIALRYTPLQNVELSVSFHGYLGLMCT